MMSKIISTVSMNYRQRPHLYSEDTVQNLLHRWSRKHEAETNVQTAYFPQQPSAQAQCLPSPDRLKACEKLCNYNENKT